MRHPVRFVSLAMAVTLSACVTLHRPVAVDPEVTFTAHPEHGEIVFDRLARGRSGDLRPPGWFRGPGDPTFVLVADGQRIAALWRTPERVVVRSVASSDAAPAGEVASSWDQGAIRLALQPVGGSAFRSDAFTREGGGTGTATLTRAAQTVLDVRGTYRATVRDAGGAAVGWLRVRISPYQEASRIYDGVLPAAVQPELAAGAVAALDGEIDWIEDHAVDVYRNNSSGPLERSIPSPR
jgi:hypothetical protein